MKKWILSFLLMSIGLWVIALPAQAKTNTLSLSVKSSPNAAFQTTLTIKENHLIRKVRSGKEITTSHPLPLTDMYITVGKRHLILGRKGYVFNAEDKKRLLLPESAEKRLLQYAKLLRKDHYGELLPWKKADELLPTGATFSVVDLETGKTFEVQRRAGNTHADVQPLTREDTKTMKAIYDGHWSWRRRAILVKADGRTIAASMHGMPHGAGALPNGFPGHFCIHFFGSTTHRTEKVDPSHKVMIYQAAGKLYDYLEKATPYEVVDAFLVAVNQKNTHQLKLTLSREHPSQIKKLMDVLKDAESIKNISSLKKEDVYTSVGVEIPVDVHIYRKGRGRTRKTLTFVVSRNAPGERWLINIDPLLESFE